MNLSIQDLMAMQAELQAKYAGVWEPICPESGQSKLLWGIGEIGEMIDIIKKRGDDAIVENQEIRAHFVEETVDVFMYLMDVLMCYGVSADEFSRIYATKHEHNMKRRFSGTKYPDEEVK